MALLQRRLGRKTAIALRGGGARAFEIEWVDQSLPDSAVGAHRGVSLVDQVSFLLMRRRSVDSAFAFEPDFETAGFRLYRA